VEVGTEQRHRASVVVCAGEGDREGTIGLPENRGSEVREMGCNSECLQVGFESGSGGKESADSLGEGWGRFHKSLTRRNCNGGSRDKDFGLPSLPSLSREHDSLSVCGGGLRGYRGGRPLARIKVAVGPGGTGGVLPFRKVLCFPGVGAFLGK